MHYKKNCYIRFTDGTTYECLSYGKKKNFFGSIVFNNCNLGYQEVITDPSYYNQVILFLNSNIGNTGVNIIDNESFRIWCSGIIVNKYRDFYSNFKSVESLKNFVKRNRTILLETSKTREIFKKIKKGFNKIQIYFKNIKKTNKKFNYNLKNHISYCCSSKISYKKLVVFDMGLKNNIINILNNKKVFLIIINKISNIELYKSININGFLVTNGPGDPREYNHVVKKVIEIIKNKIPIMGICLGHQIISISLGNKIFFDNIGQHGSNYPVIFLNKKIITTQNHNYYTLYNNSLIRNVKDFKNQGFFLKKIVSFQGHPEACPGTNDSEFIFNIFLKML
ncbi:carbamoyl phosphate synthase small subunit [Candidatus Vidania fulgoroideorum]